MLVGGRNGLGSGVLWIALLNTHGHGGSGGHSVLVVVVPPAMMCAVTAFFRVPMPAASILFDVMSRVMSTLIVDGENERGLSSSRGGAIDGLIPPFSF